jgi:hypothetical protein
VWLRSGGPLLDRSGHGVTSSAEDFVAALYYAQGIGLLAIVKEFTSVFYLSRDFARYMRSCSRRPWVVVAGFDPLAALQNT